MTSGHHPAASALLTHVTTHYHGIVLRAGNPDAPFRILGSTVGTSLGYSTHSNPMTDVVLWPTPGQDGIVALSVPLMPNERDSNGIHASGIFRITWSEQEGASRPVLDLGNAWCPENRKFSIGAGFLKVSIRDIAYRSPLGCHPSPEELRISEGIPQVDGDVLCRYLFGQAKEEEVRGSASSMGGTDIIAALRTENATLRQKRKDASDEVNALWKREQNFACLLRLLWAGGDLQETVRMTNELIHHSPDGTQDSLQALKSLVGMQRPLSPTQRTFLDVMSRAPETPRLAVA